jgi:hypothetical protein
MSYNDFHMIRMVADKNPRWIDLFFEIIEKAYLAHAIVVCFIPDYGGAYFFWEQHMKLPKDKQKNELHWSKSNEAYREKLFENYKLTLSICCDGLLAIRTNGLARARC